jgi:hypothetical protein
MKLRAKGKAMNPHSSSARERPAKARQRMAPMARFHSLLAHDGFRVLASMPLFQQWVGNTQVMLDHPTLCNSATAAMAMFELHGAHNADLENFIAQVNLLLEEGREDCDLAVIGRAMVVGLAVTLEQARGRK